MGSYCLMEKHQATQSGSSEKDSDEEDDEGERSPARGSKEKKKEQFRPANDNETVDAIPSNWKEPAPEAPPANPEPANNPQPQPPPAQQPPKPDENAAGPEKKPPPYEYKTDVFFALPAPPSPHVVQDSKKKLKNKTPGKRHSQKSRKPEKVPKHKN